MDFKRFNEWWRPRQSIILFLLFICCALQANVIKPPSLTTSNETRFNTPKTTTNAQTSSSESTKLNKKDEFMNVIKVFNNKSFIKYQKNLNLGDRLFVMVSKASWESYIKFKEETCRNEEDEYIADRVLNSTDNGYFLWEENVFHQELRRIILPETSNGSFRSLVGSPLLKSLDPRFFATSLENKCKANQPDLDEETLAKLEKDRFEDYLINKVFSPQ